MLEIITGAIGLLLYPLFAVIFNILDLLQSVFYGLAGIGEIGFGNAKMPNGEIIGSIGSANDGGETSTGLIYYLLTSDLIKNLFSSIVILALFLIIIFTAMAFIKNAYSSKQKNWQEIVGNAFKGLANFIFIPVCCLLGVWLSNILLLAINGATSNGGATMMSRKLFVSSAYEANLYRQDDIKNLSEKEAEALQTWAIGQGLQDVKVQANVNDSEYYAEIVDRVYAETNISIYRGKLVEQHYKLFAINYLTIVVGGVFMLYVLVSLAYAMIKRMFILLMLFVISPAICAMYPIDEGSAVGNWKKEFIKYTISAFGTVAAMNLFFSILPIVENIELVAGWGPWFNDIFQLLIMVSGLFVVKEFMGTLSNWIGGDNALTTGESLKKSASGALKKYATGTVKTIGAFQKARGRASAAKEAWKESHLKEGKDHLNFGQWIGKQFVGLGSMGKQGLDAGLKGVDKAALGGEAEKLFGWGHDETGKKRKSLFQQGAKAEKERMATIKTEDETERQKKLFLKGDEKKGIESGIKKFSKEFGNATTDLEKNEIMARYFEEGEDSNVSVAELEKEALKFSGLDIQDIRKMKREGVRQLNRLEYSGL